MAARSTPRGGGSTERSTSSPRSFSSRSPPRGDPDASPSRLDAATLARLVETTLPAAVVSLKRLESFLVRHAERCGEMVDGKLPPLKELIDDITLACHRFGQYSEHVTYHQVLMSHGSTIKEFIDRIVAQLKHSGNDLKRIEEELANEHIRLTESLRPLRKTLNGLQLDSPASKQLLNSMRAIQYECLGVEGRHGLASRRICEFRILYAEMQHVAGYELPTPLIKTWRALIEKSRIAAEARIEEKMALKTAMAKTEEDLARLEQKEGMSTPAAADGVIDANLRHDTDNMAIDSTLGHRVNASDGKDQRKELSKRNLARKQQMWQRDKATAKEVVLGQTGQGTMATAEEVVLDQKRESKRRLALDPNSSTVDSKATVRGQAKTPHNIQAAARAPDSPALAAASRTCDAPTSQVGPSGQRSGASADHASSVDIDHSPQAATEPRCTSMDAVAAQLVIPSVGSSNTSGPHVTDRRLDRLEESFQVLATTVQNDRQQIAHNFERVSKQAKVLRARVGGALDELDAKVEARVTRLETATEPRCHPLEAVAASFDMPNIGTSSVRSVEIGVDVNSQLATGERARNNRRNKRRREHRKAARERMKQEGLWEKTRAPPKPRTSNKGAPRRGVQPSRPQSSRTGGHKAVQAKKKTAELLSSGIANIPVRPQSTQTDGHTAVQARKKTPGLSSGIADTPVQLTKKKARESSEVVNFMSGLYEATVMGIPVSGFEQCTPASQLQKLESKLAAQCLGIILDDEPLVFL